MAEEKNRMWEKTHLKKLFKYDETINPQIQKVHWTRKQDKHKPHYTKAHHNQIVENLEWGEAKKNQTTCLPSIKHNSSELHPSRYLGLLPSDRTYYSTVKGKMVAAAAAAKSLQSCPTLCDPIESSPPGSSVPGILQARILEWVAISFSNAWKWKVKVKSLSRAWILVTPWTAAYQAPPSMGFSRQEYWSG